MRKAVMAFVFLALVVGLAPAADAQNQPPNAVFRTNPPADAGNVLAGYSPMTVTFNTCKSTDPDNDPLKYTFDLDGNGTFESIGTCRFTVIYHAVPMAGETVTACVDDRTNLDGHRICKSYYLFFNPNDAGGGPAPAEEPKTLYAVVDGAFVAAGAEVIALAGPPSDTLVTFDATTGVGTEIGAIGFEKTTALEASTGGKLYAIAKGEVDADSFGEVSGLGKKCNEQVLVEINPNTGAGDEVGPLFDPDDDDCGTEDFTDLAFNGSTLIGLAKGSVYTINTATGEATLAVDEIDTKKDGGLADRLGTVYYGSDDDDLFTVNVAGGTGTDTTVDLDYSALAEVDEPKLKAMTANGSTMNGLVEGDEVEAGSEDVVALNDVAAAAEKVRQLVAIDLTDGDVTKVVTLGTGKKVVGLAWSR